MERKKKVIELLWERSKCMTFLVLLLFAIVVYLAYVSFTSSLPLEIRIALCGLAVALTAMGGGELQHAKDEYKIEQILTKLDNVQKTDETVSPLAEGLVSIIKGIDHIYKQK